MNKTLREKFLENYDNLVKRVAELEQDLSEELSKTIDVSGLLESYQKIIAELDDANYHLKKAKDAAIKERGI